MDAATKAGMFIELCKKTNTGTGTSTTPVLVNTVNKFQDSEKKENVQSLPSLEGRLDFLLSKFRRFSEVRYTYWFKL